MLKSQSRCGAKKALFPAETHANFDPVASPTPPELTPLESSEPLTFPFETFRRMTSIGASGSPGHGAPNPGSSVPITRLCYLNYVN